VSFISGHTRAGATAGHLEPNGKLKIDKVNDFRRSAFSSFDTFWHPSVGIECSVGRQQFQDQHLGISIETDHGLFRNERAMKLQSFLG
jgi:hypothetical protein